MILVACRLSQLPRRKQSQCTQHLLFAADNQKSPSYLVRLDSILATFQNIELGKHLHDIIVNKIF